MIDRMEVVRAGAAVFSAGASGAPGRLELRGRELKRGSPPLHATTLGTRRGFRVIWEGYQKLWLAHGDERCANFWEQQ
ncbi:unnamed protein product [Lampetra planeri]